MEANLQEPFDLARLAQAAGMSEFHFSRLFKKATGLSPSHYFIRQRIAKAQQLLQETGTSIIEIGIRSAIRAPAILLRFFAARRRLAPAITVAAEARRDLSDLLIALRSLFLRMSLSQNRCTLLRDMR